MSYCRWTEDSDVYVYGDGHGNITCCGCSLAELIQFQEDQSYFNSRDFSRPSDMIEHLNLHVSIGHKVPDYAFSRLEDEMQLEKVATGRYDITTLNNVISHLRNESERVKAMIAYFDTVMTLLKESSA